jgi:hypothetical protein
VGINGVTVSLNPGNRTAITDETGHFSFKKTSTAANLTISAIGYKDVKLAGYLSGMKNNFPGCGIFHNEPAEAVPGRACRTAGICVIIIIKFRG